jgi:hypothetical protein
VECARDKVRARIRFSCSAGAAPPLRAPNPERSAPARTGPVFVNAGETLTIVDGGSVTSSPPYYGVVVQGGTLNVTGGSASGFTGVIMCGGGTVNITGGSVSGSYEAVPAAAASQPPSAAAWT